MTRHGCTLPLGAYTRAWLELFIYRGPYLDCSVHLGSGGLDALVTLGGGDMRRTLNILQVSQFAYFMAFYTFGAAAG